jgi:hypothetical protein
MQGMYRFIVMVDTFLFLRENDILKFIKETRMQRLITMLIDEHKMHGCSYRLDYINYDVTQVSFWFGKYFQAKWELDGTNGLWSARRLDKSGDYLFLN